MPDSTDPCAYLLCGLAFKGRRALAQHLSMKTGARIVHVVESADRRGLPAGLDLPTREWATAHKKALIELSHHLEAGRSVVVDDTCCFRFVRDNYRRVARFRKARVVLLVLDVPLNVVLASLRENAGQPALPPGTEEVLRDLATRFEWPGDDEFPIVLRDRMGIDSWLQTNLPRIRPPLA